MSTIFFMAGNTNKREISQIFKQNHQTDSPANLDISDRDKVKSTNKLRVWVTRLGPKMGQIGLKWDKSGTFSDQISVHLGAPAPRCTEI